MSKEELRKKIQQRKNKNSKSNKEDNSAMSLEVDIAKEKEALGGYKKKRLFTAKFLEVTHKEIEEMAFEAGMNKSAFVEYQMRMLYNFNKVAKYQETSINELQGRMRRIVEDMIKQTMKEYRERLDCFGGEDL